MREIGQVLPVIRQLHERIRAAVVERCEQAAMEEMAAVAPNRGKSTGLQDIELAVQTEIPLVKQHLADVLWAVRGEGVSSERWNRLSGERNALKLQPSQARDLAHGFATVVRFFPGVREELAALDEEIMRAALGAPRARKAISFEDQYISSQDSSTK
jgi:hypothetical protein